MRTKKDNYVKENDAAIISVRQECSKLPKEQIGLYTIKDLMSIFGVCRRTISNWQSSGRLSYVKIGNLLYVSRQQLEDFLQYNTVEGFKRYGRSML